MMDYLHAIATKIVSPTELTSLLSGRGKVVFTNGCFDILHRGHLTYLAKAAGLGDILVVGLNTDTSVKRQGKGDDRPIHDEQARAFLLAGLACVSYVVFFDANTPLELIKAIKPDVLVKGADYDDQETDESSKRYIVGANETRKSGGKVVAIDLVDGFSTTKTLEKIRLKK